jgi:sucrose-6-phosphate hydrolase SacC (GH32 family)
MYNPANKSKPEQVLPYVDEGAGVGCSGAGPRGSILRSPSSPTANVSDPKVNWVSRGNFMPKVQGAMVFPDRS